MYRTRFAPLMLMAALGAMSAGAAAVASAYPDDGKTRLEHAGTGQVCAFDTSAAADDFLANVDDATSWAPVTTGETIAQALEHAEDAKVEALAVPAAVLTAEPSAETVTEQPAATETPAPAPAADQAPAPAAPKTRKTAAKA